MCAPINTRAQHWARHTGAILVLSVAHTLTHIHTLTHSHQPQVGKGSFGGARARLCYCSCGHKWARPPAVQTPPAPATHDQPARLRGKATRPKVLDVSHSFLTIIRLCDSRSVMITRSTINYGVRNCGRVVAVKSTLYLVFDRFLSSFFAPTPASRRPVDTHVYTWY